MDCPYCGECLLEELEQEYTYEDKFDFRCPKCKKIMEVCVELMPEFHTYKKNPPDDKRREDG